jgi:hypothetical protein
MRTLLRCVRHRHKNISFKINDAKIQKIIATIQIGVKTYATLNSGYSASLWIASLRLQ